MARIEQGSLLKMDWHADVDLILRDPENRLVCLVGEPGAGKTTYAKEKARQVTGQEPEVIDGGPGFEERHLFGKTELAAKNGATITVDADGPLIRALRHQRWLILEEFSLIPNEMRAYFLGQRGQKAIVNPQTDELVRIPPSFRLIATSNPENIACRRSGTSRALLDGFITIDIPEPTAKDVEAWLRFHYPKASAAKIGFVLEKWTEYRALASANERDKVQYLSYRGAGQLLRLVEAGMNPEKAVRYALVNKYISDPDLYATAKLRASIA